LREKGIIRNSKGPRYILGEGEFFTENEWLEVESVRETPDKMRIEQKANPQEKSS